MNLFTFTNQQDYHYTITKTLTKFKYSFFNGSPISLASFTRWAMMSNVFESLEKPRHSTLPPLDIGFVM